MNLFTFIILEGGGGAKFAPPPVIFLYISENFHATNAMFMI